MQRHARGLRPQIGLRHRDHQRHIARLVGATTTVVTNARSHLGKHQILSRRHRVAFGQSRSAAEARILRWIQHEHHALAATQMPRDRPHGVVGARHEMLARVVIQHQQSLRALQPVTSHRKDERHRHGLVATIQPHGAIATATGGLGLGQSHRALRIRAGEQQILSLMQPRVQARLGVGHLDAQTHTLATQAPRRACKQVALAGTRRTHHAHDARRHLQHGARKFLTTPRTRKSRAARTFGIDRRTGQIKATWKKPQRFIGTSHGITKQSRIFRHEQRIAWRKPLPAVRAMQPSHQVPGRLEDGVSVHGGHWHGSLGYRLARSPGRRMLFQNPNTWTRQGPTACHRNPISCHA